MKWSRKSVLNFIEDYKANTILWDKKLLDYRNNDLKETALRTLAKKYDCNISQIKRKIKSLRYHFLRENTKMKQTGITSKWYGYRPMSFVQDQLSSWIRVTHNWSPETVLSLIKDYRANPCLWDYKVPGGFRGIRNLRQKKDLLPKLAKKHNRDVRDIRMKLRNLRHEFKLQHKKSSRLGEPSKWFAYQPLSFLLTANDGSSQLQEVGKVTHNWSPETVLSLIEDYHANPCLWDHRVPGGFTGFTNLYQKKVILPKLAEKYNRTVRDIKMKLKALRDKFRKEHEKSRRLCEPSKWFAYQPLSFLSIVYDGNLQPEKDGEKEPTEKNGNNDVIENRLPSSNLLNDMSMDSTETESDSEDSEQSMECLSERTSISESTDQNTNEPEPMIKIYARKQHAKYNSVKQMNYSEEDLKFSESLLPHIRNIPAHKKLHFRKKAQELVQMFAYSDFSENNAQIPMEKIEPDSSFDAARHQSRNY